MSRPVSRPTSRPTGRLVQLQRALAAHVVDGDDVIGAAIDESVAVSASARLKIYWDAYRLRLIEALEANYPALARLTGETAFGRMAQEYLAVYPSRHFSIRWFGHRLAEFLGEFPEYRDRPWLIELASWEWKIATAFDAAEATLLAAAHLSSVLPDRWPELQFNFHPSVQRLAVEWNVVAIVKATAEDRALPEPTLLESRTEWLIWRKNLAVQYRSLDGVEVAAIDAALRGVTFGEICEVIATLIDARGDAGQAPLRAASLLHQWIADDCLVDRSTNS